MNDYEPQPEERVAKKEQARWVSHENVEEKRKTDEAFMSNFERLKAERKAREQLA